ncbi:MAG: hypothetical protein R3212_03675 [Xanthomonadales bacterium]|nr:hypothetical protein [Xanthomonadales bacterium]
MNRRPTFFHDVLVAAGLGLAASILVVVLTPLLGLGSVIRIGVPMLCLAYLLYTMGKVKARTGRVITLVAWAGFALLCAWFVDSLSFYLLLHAGAIWLIRSLYAYSSLIPAFADLALSTLAAAMFAWAFMRTGSVFLATWCFFLVQALWTQLPRGRKRHRPAPAAGSNEFERARRRADAALRQLINP